MLSVEFITNSLCFGYSNFFYFLFRLAGYFSNNNKKPKLEQIILKFQICRKVLKLVHGIVRCIHNECVSGFNFECATQSHYVNCFPSSRISSTTMLLLYLVGLGRITMVFLLGLNNPHVGFRSTYAFRYQF